MKQKTQTKQKLYCYVDETGQDTQGLLFLVAVVIQAKEADNIEKIEQILETIEKKSRKQKHKWTHSTKKERRNYIKEIIKTKLFFKSIFYADYKKSTAYLDLTIFTTAKAILQKAKEFYEARVWIDGLKKSEQTKVAAGLRKLKVKVSKVRGIKDENSSLIRLVDAIAGFIRDCLEGDEEMIKLYKQIKTKGILKKI